MTKEYTGCKCKTRIAALEARVEELAKVNHALVTQAMLDRKLLTGEK